MKVDRTYYRNVLLSQHMLPGIRQLAGEVYVFQQDNAPVHHTRSTVKFLHKEVPDFIPPELWPPYSPDLNPVHYRIWDCMQERLYKKPIRDLAELKQRLVKVWADFDSQSTFTLPRPPLRLDSRETPFARIARATSASTLKIIMS